MFRKIAITIIVIATIVWFYNDNKATKEWDIKYKKSSFNGIIKDTIHYELQHDLPTYIFTNDSSHFSDIREGYMQSIAKVGDSLSKVSGNDTVYIFKKKIRGDYIQVYPKNKIAFQ
ncbi:MAG: hypothetical protein JWQ09_1211 [Segetibacter sp.]|nr:hypothetical protein [Segetibacter sp.]